MKYLYYILPLIFINCIPYQIDNVNNQADQELIKLDRQCRANMTDWCKLQYQRVEDTRNRNLAELEARRQAIIQSMNKSTIHCTSHKNYYNEDVETICN